jgi:thymidylate kinase
VSTGLIDCLGTGFWRRNKLFHWRPQALFIKRDQTINSDPHGKPARSAMLSMAYLSAFFLDHWVGYIFKVRPALGRANFVIFDRYFHDVLVDPRRYRYGGPLWYAKFLAGMVPEPNVVILLDADEHSIAARKCEVPLLEIKNQLHKYRALQFQRAPKIVVDTQSGIDATLRSSSRAITEIMGVRLRNRLRNWQETAS